MATRRPVIRNGARYEDLASGDTLPAGSVVSAPPWQPGPKTAGQLWMDGGILFLVIVDMATSNAGPSTYNSSQFYRQLTFPQAYVSSSYQNGTLTLVRVNGQQDSYAIGGGGGGAAATVRDVFNLAAETRNAAVAGGYVNGRFRLASDNADLIGSVFYTDTHRYEYAPLATGANPSPLFWFRTAL